jgi:hypothetical protein
MVKAMAPNAPTGAAFIRMATTLNITIDRSSNSSPHGRRARPTSASAMPNRIETNSTWRMLPSVKAR